MMGAVRRPTVLLAVLAVLAVVAACGDDDDPPQVIGTTVAGAEEITVIGTDFAFEPSTLELTVGEPVNITLEVTDGGHDLSVVDVGFRLPILDEGESAVGTLVIDAPGTYQLVCNVPGHIDEGMVGTVTVT
jgi:cytochrome c oxidase subunit 2